MKNVIRYSIIFWIVFYIIIAVLLLPVGDTSTILIRVASFVIPQIFLFYINLLYLLPNYTSARKWHYFGTLLILLVGITVFIGKLDIYFDEIIPLDIAHLKERPDMFTYIGRFMSSIPPLIISALIRNSFLLQAKTKESLELQNKMLAAETKALKAQINPHFLFNTLNNIYSLSQFDNKKTGDAILQLSDILRYVTYDANHKFVALSAELEHIRSFIKLQLLSDEDASNISVEIDVTNEKAQIIPLLLIPFIENCFKHSNHHDKKNGWIKISVYDKGSTLHMEVSNSVSGEGTNKDKVGGVGMENVRKRLSLLYPDKHDLVLKMDKTYYASTLKIDLQK